MDEKTTNIRDSVKRVDISVFKSLALAMLMPSMLLTADCSAALSLHAILVEVSAAGGTFCISFMQMFAEDDYLNAFLDKLCQQGIGYEIADRHRVMLAPISDYRREQVTNI